MKTEADIIKEAVKEHQRLQSMRDRETEITMEIDKLTAELGEISCQWMYMPKWETSLKEKIDAAIKDANR